MNFTTVIGAKRLTRIDRIEEPRLFGRQLLASTIDDSVPEDPHYAPTGVYHSWEHWKLV